jgi:hypothetical protein
MLNSLVSDGISADALSHVYESYQSACRRLDNLNEMIMTYDTDDGKSVIIRKNVYNWDIDTTKNILFNRYVQHKNHLRWVEIFATYRELLIDALWKLYNDGSESTPEQKDASMVYIANLIMWKHTALTHVRPSQFDYNRTINMTWEERAITDYYLKPDINVYQISESGSDDSDAEQVAVE